MEFNVSVESLKKVVSCTSRATSNKAVQPILGNILLSSENGSLIVSATDLDLAIECKLPAGVTKPGMITLPAKKFDEIVSKVPGEEINVSIDKNQLAKIVCDRSRFQINGISPEDFPKLIKKKDNDVLFSVDVNELLLAISLTSFSASKYETTSILSGVNFEIKGNKFEVGATDGSRLARFIGSLASGSSEEKEKLSVVIPLRAVLELERLLLNFKEGNDVVSFFMLPGQIIFQNNDFSMSTRLLSGSFPAYDKLIPKEQPNKALFSRVELLSSLERVAILSNERTSVIKLSCVAGSKTARLSAQSPDYGNATDEIDVDYGGDNLEIAFNYRYLAEALRNLQVEKVLLEFETPLSPVLLQINEEADYSYTYLIMPVQLR